MIPFQLNLKMKETVIVVCKTFAKAFLKDNLFSRFNL